MYVLMVSTMNDKVLTALRDLATFSPVQMQESEFVSDFLPMLAADTEVNLLPWVEKAGGPFNPVDVFQGETFLYQVPALLDSRDDMLNGLKDVDVRSVVMKAVQESNDIPRLGDRTIIRELKDRFGTNPLSASTMISLNSIFKRYGYKEYDLGLVPEDAIQSTNLINTNVDDDDFVPM